jgi:hypothetical protein
VAVAPFRAHVHFGDGDSRVIAVFDPLLPGERLTGLENWVIREVEVRLGTSVGSRPSAKSGSSVSTSRALHLFPQRSSAVLVQREPEYECRGLTLGFASNREESSAVPRLAT